MHAYVFLTFSPLFPFLFFSFLLFFSQGYDGFFCSWSPFVDLYHSNNKITPPKEYLSPSQAAKIEEEKKKAKDLEIQQNRLAFEAKQKEIEKKKKEKEKKAQAEKQKKDEAFHRELEKMKLEKSKKTVKQRPSETEGASVSVGSGGSTVAANENMNTGGGSTWGRTTEKSSSSTAPTLSVTTSNRFHGAHLIFEGMMVGKKFKHDIMNHSRFCWIDPDTGRFHWSKHKNDKQTSKSIDLRRDVTGVAVTHRTHVVFTHVLGNKNTIVLEATDEPNARLWYNVANCIREAPESALSTGTKKVEEDEVTASISGHIDTQYGDDEEDSHFRIA